MTIHSTLRFMTVALMALGLLFSALTASASKQALVEVRFKNEFFSVGSDFSPRSATWLKSGTVLVTVDTPAATPSIMWPANLISGAQSFTYNGFYTVFGSQMETYMMKAGTIAKSWAGAAPSGGSALVPAAAPTSLCFASNPPFAPGPTGASPLPNSCFPRYGSGMRAPGAKKYGGTARILRDSNAIGTFVGYPSGLTNFAFFQAYSSRLTGASAVGEYGLAFSGTVTNTVLNVTGYSQGPETGVPFTTGMATVMGGAYYTQLTRTGSHNFNTANLTGMISIVKPFLRNRYRRDTAGNFTGAVGAGFHAMRTLSFTFGGEVPEPGTSLMLGFGALGLTGLAALRRR